MGTHCTARYEKCTGVRIEGRLKMCSACISAEVEWFRSRRVKAQIELEDAERELARLGHPIKKLAMTLWSSKKGA